MLCDIDFFKDYTDQCFITLLMAVTVVVIFEKPLPFNFQHLPPGFTGRPIPFAFLKEAFHEPA